MPENVIEVRRFHVTSAQSFEDVVEKFEANLGRPDMNQFRKDITAAKTEDALEEVVHKAVGPVDLMEFNRFNLGEVLQKELGEKAAKSVRFLVGNPLLMKQMVKFVPDAGSYAPVTVLIDERTDGVHLTYDTMASFLASYGNPEALKVARDLDSKIERLLMAAGESNGKS